MVLTIFLKLAKSLNFLKNEQVVPQFNPQIYVEFIFMLCYHLVYSGLLSLHLLKDLLVHYKLKETLAVFEAETSIEVRNSYIIVANTIYIYSFLFCGIIRHDPILTRIQLKQPFELGKTTILNIVACWSD